MEINITLAGFYQQFKVTLLTFVGVSEQFVGMPPQFEGMSPQFVGMSPQFVGMSPQFDIIPLKQ